VALLASSGDKDWPFAPNEAISTAADEARWAEILSGYKPVDYVQMVELEDGTDQQGESACVGGACAIV
jgi:ribonucleoside-triphosphate reductase (thioredoxin)